VQWVAAGSAPVTSRVPAAPDPPLPVPQASDLLLARAASLFERGHLHEALDVLDRVRLADPRRADADKLEADIQRMLLDGVATPAIPSRRATPPDLPR
jgi:hypothetical protein